MSYFPSNAVISTVTLTSAAYLFILIAGAGMIQSANTDRIGSASGTRRDSVAAMLNFLILSQWIGRTFSQLTRSGHSFRSVNQTITSFSLTEKAVYK